MTNIVELIFKGDTSELGKGIADAGGKLDKFKVVAGAAGGLAGAALGMGMSNAVDLSNMQSKLDAGLGTAGGISAKAGQVAGKVFSDGYSSSMADVGEAVKTVMQSGAVGANDSAAAIQGVTEKAMALSSTFGGDLEGTTNAVAQMIRTGLAKDGTQALDMLAAGFQQGNNKAGDLLDTMNEYGTQFRKLGMDGTTAMGLLKQGLQGGARDADLVADAIKEFSIRAVDGSKTTAAGFQSIGLNAHDMAEQIAKGGPAAQQGLATVLDKLRAIKDPALQAQAATALFGTQAEDLGKALYALHPETAAAGMGQVAGAAQKVQDSTQSADQKIQAIKNSFVVWSGSMVNSVGPLGTVAQYMGALGPQALTMAGSLGTAAMGFAAIVPKITAAISATITWGSTQVVEGAKGAAAMAATAGRYVAAWTMMVLRAGASVLMLTGQLIVWAATQVAQGAVALGSMAVTAAGYIASWVVAAAGAMVNAVIMAAAWFIALGPVGWVIAIIVGLVALIIANWTTVSSTTVAIFTAIWSFLVNLWNTIVAWVIGKVTALVNGAIGIFHTFQAANAALWAAIGNVIQGAINFVMNGVNNFVAFWSSIPGRIGAALGGLGNIIGGAFHSALNAAIGFVNGGIDRINGLISGINYVGGFVGLSIPSIPHIPTFHQGGVIPGPKGSEMLAVLQAGETVLPTQGGKGIGGGGGGTITFAGDLDSAFASAFMRMVREGKIQGDF